MEQVISILKALLAFIGALVLAILYPLYDILVPRSFRRYDITDKIVLISGGGSGIGRRVAIRLAEKGAKIISWDINTAANEETARLIKKAGGVCKTFTVDLCKKEEIYSTAKIVKQTFRKVDILINNAGLVAGKSFLDIPDDMINKVFAVNTFSIMWTCKAFLPAMMKSNDGQIVTIASLGGIFGVPRQTEYGASKFAAVGFDEALGYELACEGYNGISLTIVCPYYINTGMFSGASTSVIPILDQEFAADEIADAILMKKRQLIMPKIFGAAVAIKGMMTHRGMGMFSRAVGIDQSMVNFTGRKSH